MPSSTTRAKVCRGAVGVGLALVLDACGLGATLRGAHAHAMDDDLRMLALDAVRGVRNPPRPWSTRQCIGLTVRRPDGTDGVVDPSTGLLARFTRSHARPWSHCRPADTERGPDGSSPWTPVRLSDVERHADGTASVWASVEAGGFEGSSVKVTARQAATRWVDVQRTGHFTTCTGGYALRWTGPPKLLPEDTRSWYGVEE